VKETLKSADGLVGNTDKQIQTRMQELGVILQNLKVATTYAKAAFETLGKQPHRLIFGGKANELPTESEILKTNKPVPIKRDAPKKP
jgi:hypothetical protein